MQNHSNIIRLWNLRANLIFAEQKIFKKNELKDSHLSISTLARTLAEATKWFMKEYQTASQISNQSNQENKVKIDGLLHMELLLQLVLEFLQSVFDVFRCSVFDVYIPAIKTLALPI